MSVPALILSDLHLGAPHSVLNLKQWSPSEVEGVKHGEVAREDLVAGIKQQAGSEQVERLILLGDVIDLSHGTLADGLREMITLVRRIRDDVSIKELVFVPGNHDRHWWDMQCQYESMIKPLLDDAEASSNTFYARTTDTAGRRKDIPVITNPLHEHNDLPITVAYPDYEFSVAGKRIRCSHGHLFEDLYLMVADLLHGVQKDFSNVKRRDPQQAPTGKQKARFDAAKGAFLEALVFTLDPGAAAHGDLELAERLSAPLVNLDWLLLGQTGLLRREGTGTKKALGRALNEFLADLTNNGKEALVGFGEFVALSGMDIVAKRDDGKPHSYSNNAVKTNLITPLIEKIVGSMIKKDADLPLPKTDSPSTSLSRGKDLKDKKAAIEHYLERFSVPRPDVLIFGHTHVKGQGPFKKGGQTMLVMNTGSWTSSVHRKVPDSRIGRIGDQGDVSFQDVDLGT